MIRIDRLRVGDIVGTTSGSPLACIIKGKTWGWRSIFHQDLASHIATVVDRGKGLLYFAEMVPDSLFDKRALKLTEIHAYDHWAPRQHVCWVGRHYDLDSKFVRTRYNDFILSAHAHQVRYGFEDLVNFLPGVHFRDNPKTWICSELPREAFKKCGIPYSAAWEMACAPRDWQEWGMMENITGRVIG